MPGNVVVQRELDGTYTPKVVDDAKLTVIDMGDLSANPSIAVRRINQLIALGTPDSFLYARELLDWLETNTTITVTP